MMPRFFLYCFLVALCQQSLAYDVGVLNTKFSGCPDAVNGDCSGAVLVGTRSLRNADLSGADLSYIDLSSVDFSGTNLANTNLTGADLRYATLVGLDLRTTNLSGVNLASSCHSLIESILLGVNLSGADLSYCEPYYEHDLTGANLSGVDMSWSTIRGINLTNVNLAGIDLSNTQLEYAQLSGADLSNANLTALFSENILSAPSVLPVNWRYVTNTSVVGYLAGPGGYYAAKSINDFDADWDDDVLLRSSSSSKWKVFSFQGGVVADNTSYNAYSNPDWQHVANFDVDGDGDRDVLLRNVGTHKWAFITTENGNAIASQNLPQIYSSSDYVFQAVIDADGDGDDDILLRDTVSGQWRLFEVQAGSVIGSSGFALWSDNTYQLAATGDFDGSRDDDVLLRSTVTGKYRLFSVGAGAVTGSTNLPELYASSDYAVFAASDFDGDRHEDLLLRNTVTGAWRLFKLQNGAVVSDASFNLYSNLGWGFESVGDFDGNGHADVLLRNASGIWRLFDVESGAVTGSSPVGIYSNTDWRIQE